MPNRHTTITILSIMLAACGPDLAPPFDECPAMTEGCEAGLICNAGICEACVEGSEGCWCMPDGTCGIGLECGAAFVCEPEGTIECDYLGCACTAGGCVENLVCELSEHCSPCPPGSPGCPCGADGYCKVGECSTGQDADTTAWSICYPADLLGCALEPCPGDAHCTDDMTCAWAD